MITIFCAFCLWIVIFPGLTQLAQSLSRSLLVGGGELMAGWVRFQKNCGSSKGNKPCNTWRKAQEANHVLHGEAKSGSTM